MRLIRRLALPVSLGLAVLVAACSKNAATDDNAPLSFVPADTPYAVANLEPTPAAITEAWAQRMKGYWPTLLQMYEGILTRAQSNKADDPNVQRGVKIARAILDEFNTDDLVARAKQMGFKTDGRYAMYGVGVVPVIRIELGDPAAFKAEVGKIEAKVGEKLPVGRVGDLDYWRVGDEKAVAVAAVERNQLVLTILPASADETLQKTILGLTKPAQNLGQAGTLQAIAKQYNLTNNSIGFIDFVKLTDRITNPAAGTDADFAKALGVPWVGTDPACRTDYLDIAHKFPRLVGGVAEMAPQRMRMAAQFEMDASIAQPLAAALSAAPGTGAKGEGIFDIALSTPVLKLKDWWIARADAVAAKPYTCPHLVSLNEGFASSRAKADTTVPPPFSDLTGARFTLDQLLLKDGVQVPDISAKLALRTNNPVALLAMAQLALPALAALKVQPDGKAVTIPPGTLPMAQQPLAVAMTADTLGMSSGAGEEATLGAYLAEPAAKEPVFLRVYFTGKIYSLMAQGFAKFKATMPPEQQAQVDMQTKIFASYEQWLKSIDFNFTATPTGIAIHETVELN